MLRRLMLISISTWLFQGCMVMGHDCGEGGMCGGRQGDTRGCASVADCPNGTRCGSDASCVADDGPGVCTNDDQCGANAYCDAATGRCTLGTACQSESDCAEGFNCDLARSFCLPSPDPTCAELAAEAECVARPDCVPIYAGIECSCGPDCTCQGGEPGCVCQSFEFFRCADAGS